MANQLLPPRAAELANIVGLSNALRVCEVLGGLYRYVPYDYADHPLFVQLAALIGESDARKIMEHYAGSFLELPKCERWFHIKVRNVLLLQDGKKIDHLAAEHQLTRRRVFQIRAEFKEDKNLDLFD